MSTLALHGIHEKLGARFTEVNGMPAVADYGDPLSEYRMLRESAGVLDLSFRSRVCLTGSDRVRFLHGQVTNDVKRLVIGEGCYAALITAKGKMQSDLNIYCLNDEFLLDFEPGLTEAVSRRLEQYIIADDVQVVDVTPHYGLLSVQGPKAETVLRAVEVLADVPIKPFSFCRVTSAVLGEIYIMNQPRLGTKGFDLFVPVPALRAVQDTLLAAAKCARGQACGWQALEIARIETGIPRFGADMDETNIPLEAGLGDRAISFNKGCYIGQEVISRIRTYGQVTKALRSLQLPEGLKSLPVKGDKLFHAGKEVGYVTSAAVSPGLHANIALGYVRKEVNQTGTKLVLRTAEAESEVEVR